MHGNVEALSDHERDHVLHFLLHRMGMDTRGALMTELPVAYTKLYPTAKEAVIEHVRLGVEAVHA